MRTFSIVGVALGVGLLALGCEDEESCTTELRTAVTVTVIAPEGTTVDRVTADQGTEAECWPEGEDDAGESLTFRCYEQGAGTYTIRVERGDETWTDTVEVPMAGDGCHVVGQTLTVDLNVAP